ncbi:hypothetical protein IWW54_005052 [Coemansia sp. RSA 2705]|nr:hypothetical protein IWW54_005052 [Coemansia sp. RSA 2705]
MHQSASWVLLLSLVSQAAQARWAMTQQPAQERAHACQEQVSFCYNACGAVARTTTNFCNIRTMGWNCVCADKAAEARVRHYEWPIAGAECRAALNMCNNGCAARADAQQRATCFTSCTSDYPCNTAAAPMSSLRVQGASDKPAGFIPPTDDKDIEISIGMKFDTGDGDQGSGSRRMQKSGDLGALPKTIPRDSDDDAAGRAGAGRGGSRGRDGGGSGGKDGSGGREIVSAATKQLGGVPLHVLAGVLVLGSAALH